MPFNFGPLEFGLALLVIVCAVLVAAPIVRSIRLRRRHW